MPERPPSIDLLDGTNENGAAWEPTLISAISDGAQTEIQGTLNNAAAPNTTFILDFYASLAANEAQAYLGSTTVTTDGSGFVAFTARVSVAVTDGKRITATATNERAGSTSDVE